MPASVLLCKFCNTPIRRQTPGQRGHWCPVCKALRGNHGVYSVAASPPDEQEPPSTERSTVSRDGRSVAQQAADEEPVTAVSGIGPGTAARLLEQHGIVTLTELVAAIDDGTIEDERLRELVLAHLSERSSS